MLLINGIFFVPKRAVTIEIVDMTDTLRQIVSDQAGNAEVTRNSLNHTLEIFYNAKKEPENTYVSHFCFYNNIKNKKVPEKIEGSLFSLQSSHTLARTQVPDSIWHTVTSEVARIKELGQDVVTMNGNLILDYYFDSLDIAELKASIQSKCSLSSNPPVTDLKTVADVIQMAMGKSVGVEPLKPCQWIYTPRPRESIYNILQAHHAKLSSIYPPHPNPLLEGEVTITLPSPSRRRVGDEVSNSNESNILSLFRETFRHDTNDSFVYDNIL